MLDWHFIGRDSLVLSSGACAIIAAVLRYNPRLFLADFPRAIRDVLPPKTAAERRQSLIFGLLLIAWIVGGLLWSASEATQRLGVVFAPLAVRTFIIGMSFNLADWLIIDELWLGLVRPKWLFPENLRAQAIAFEHGKHFRDFLKGAVIFAVIACLVAGAVLLVADETSMNVALAANACHEEIV